MQEAVANEVRTVLGLSSTQILDINKGFFEVGMDSLIALELKNRLQTLLGETLPNTLAFDYPTLRTLTNFLINLVIRDYHPKNVENDKVLNQSNQINENIIKMTDDEARSKLEEILRQINPGKHKDE